MNSTSIFFRQKLSCKTVIGQLPLFVLSCDVSSGLPSVCIWIQNFCSFITLTGYLNSESTNPIILGLSLLPILWHFFNSTILTTDSHFIRNANMPEKQRVCLAYSGGLDTSVSNVVYLCFTSSSSWDNDCECKDVVEREQLLWLLRIASSFLDCPVVVCLLRSPPLRLLLLTNTNIE